MRILPALLALVMPVWCCAEMVVPVRTVDEYVNIRLMPDSKTEIVGHLNQGESVALVGTQEGWHEVVLEGDATGYISADWTVVLDENAVNEWYQPVIEEAVEEEPVEVEAAPKAEPEPVAQPEPEPDSGTDRR